MNFWRKAGTTKFQDVDSKKYLYAKVMSSLSPFWFAEALLTSA
jgi:hypothetical protein